MIQNQRMLCLRCLQTLRPLVSEEDLAYSAAVVEEFGQPRGLGELLQEQLLQKVKRTENWVRKVVRAQMKHQSAGFVCIED